MKIMFGVFLLLLIQGVELQEEKYYAFAYFVGNNNTLVYSDIESFQLTNTNPTKLKQEFIKIQRTNTQRFIRFVRHHHPEVMPSFVYTSDVNCIFIAKTEDDAFSMLALKKSASEDSHQKVNGFPFSFPQNAAKPLRDKN